MDSSVTKHKVGDTCTFRDMSLITGKGGGEGLQYGRGACEVLPPKKNGGRKKF